ncbi:MAG: hypothetical protein ACKO37_03285 [Vampirovibrionales bacterium]
MTMQHFKNAKTVSEIKQLYHSLAMQHHPDRGGDTATMQEINAQYMAALKAANNTQDGEKTYKFDEKAETETYQMLLQVLALNANLTVAIIGKWLWVKGDTKPVKDWLKARAFIWHSEKLCWYFRPESERKKIYRGKGQFHNMAQQYGAAVFDVSKAKNMPVAA